MLGFIKKIFIRLLASVVSASSHMKSASLSYQKFTAEPIIINLQPTENIQGIG